MRRSAVDATLARIESGGFEFPLGVYPIEQPIAAIPGYVLEFEPADGDDEGDWEEWPDRYMFDIAITHKRLEPLCSILFAFLPPRVYPILDVLGEDAYREIDPYIAYDPVSYERFIDGVRKHRGWLYEDGMVGFGAMSIEPFLYIFVDEHKILTIRAEVALRERIERLLQSFDLKPVEEIGGVDSVEHEHRSVLASEESGEQVATFAEVVEDLRDCWLLSLNVDWESNVDDAGEPLGNTPFRTLVRRRSSRSDEVVAWYEAVVVAGSLGEAELLALEAAGEVATRAGGRRPDIDELEMIEAVRLDKVEFALSQSPTAKPESLKTGIYEAHELRD